jgi:hypothetical protein
MMKNAIRRFFVILLPAALLAGAGPVQGQSIWLEPPSRTDVNLEFVKPAIKNTDLTTFSLIYYLSGRFAVGSNTQLVAEIPFAHYAQANATILGPFTRPAEADNAFGNPYLGLNFGPHREGWQMELGVRLPMAESRKRATAMAALGDFLERTEAFLPDVLTVVIGANFRSKTADGVTFRARMAPIVWIGTGDNAEMDPEVFFLYALQAGYDNRTVAVGGGLSGRFFVTGDDLNIGERTLHQLGLYGNFDFGGWGPGLQVRFPLDDDLSSILDPTLSLSISWRPL